MNKSKTLITILSIGVFVAMMMYIINSSGIFEKSHEVEYQAGINSIEKGIDNYIIDKRGELPGNLEGSGTYEVCKQGMTNCPEGSISLDILVQEGYLKEIPTSYLAETDSLTGYKLAYDSNKAVINVQNEEAPLVSSIKPRGSFTFTKDAQINNTLYADYNIVIEAGVTLTLTSDSYEFASITNYGKIYTKTNKLEIQANNFTNLGEFVGEQSDLSFITFNDFINTGLLSANAMEFDDTKAGNITIITKYLSLANASLQGFSATGNHGKLNLFYKNKFSTDPQSFTPHFAEISFSQLQ